jgi:hypothetical protein
LETDIHPFVAGANFDEIWNNRVDDQLGDTPTHLASLNDLIRMKRAAGRPKDLADLQALLKLQQMNEDQVEAPPESD